MERLHIAGRTIGITSYAARRMAIRGITRDDIRRVMADPTSVAPSRDSSFRLVYSRSVDGRRLSVVIEGVPGESSWVVVTTWRRGQDG